MIMAACLLTASCNNIQKKTASPADETSNVQKIAESGEFIDINIKKFSDELSTVNTKVLSALKNDKDKAFAALYRFYSHVQLIDSCYVCSLKSAAEINVSQTVFETLKNNLDDMNEQIESLRKAGEKVSLRDVDNDYLKSLLR
mgnify:CR=1 FL=1